MFGLASPETIISLFCVSLLSSWSFTHHFICCDLAGMCTHTHTQAYVHTLVQTSRRRLQEQIFIVYSARGEKQKMTVEEKQREAERRRERRHWMPIGCGSFLGEREREKTQ